LVHKKKFELYKPFPIPSSPFETVPWILWHVFRNGRGWMPQCGGRHVLKIG
jgi:hypothetical protein